ncbi:MAG: AtpZ/AtpI family protein [Acidimicrobiia bacterium]
MTPRIPREDHGPSSGEAWVAGSAFLGSILSGTLLGYMADLWLGTKPWLIVIGIVAGSFSGFVRMWRLSEQMESGPGER